MSTSRPDALDSGPVPEDNVPGHHPSVEQDKPDLDQFAAKLGVPPEIEPTNGEVDEPAAVRSGELVDAPGPPRSGATSSDPQVVAAGRFGPPPTAADAAVVAELGVMAPVAEVRDAAHAWARASVRLFVITPLKVGWFVGESVASEMVRRLR